jgi:hypothetical protein
MAPLSRARHAGLALAAGFALMARPAAAQVAGLPVFNTPVPLGVSAGLDAGFNGDEAGGGTAFGASVGYGSGIVGITATLATWSPDDGDAITSIGGTMGVRVLGGPLNPLSVQLQGGVGFWKQDAGVAGDVEFLHVPLGVAVGMVIPSPAVSLRPWIAPRLDLLHADTEDVTDEGDWLTDFGLSAGLDLAFIGGLGLRAAYDVVSRDDDRPSVFSVGVNYVFSLPGL